MQKYSYEKRIDSSSLSYRCVIVYVRLAPSSSVFPLDLSGGLQIRFQYHHCLLRRLFPIALLWRGWMKNREKHVTRRNIKDFVFWKTLFTFRFQKVSLPCHTLPYTPSFCRSWLQLYDNQWLPPNFLGWEKKRISLPATDIV